MNRIARTAAAAVIAGATITAGATTASAADAYSVASHCARNVVQKEIRLARMNNPSTSAGVSDYQLALAGKEGVRLRHERINAQLGVVRSRLFDGIGYQVARDNFGGGRFAVSRYMAINFPNCWG